MNSGGRTIVCVSKVCFIALYFRLTIAFAAAVYGVSGFRKYRLFTVTCFLYADHISPQFSKSRQRIPRPADSMLSIHSHISHRVCVVIQASCRLVLARLHSAWFSVRYKPGKILQSPSLNKNILYSTYT